MRSNGVDRERRLQLVKLGGSLLTDKTGDQVVNREVLARICAELASALQDPDCLPIVLGHGSGSFGHVAAERFAVPSYENWRQNEAEESVGRGHGGPKVRGEAVIAVQDVARKLHDVVLQLLRDAGVAAVSLPPAAWMMRAADGRVLAHLGALAAALDNGAVPVVFGDVLWHEGRGASVNSTETVLTAVARGMTEWRVERALWMGVTDGIWDQDRVRIDRVSGRNVARVRSAAGGSEGTDVTGGMRHRLTVLWDHRDTFNTSWILDGSQRGVFENALLGLRVG